MVARAAAGVGLGWVRVGWGRRERLLQLLMGCESCLGALGVEAICKARGTMAAACAVGERGALDCRGAAKRDWKRCERDRAGGLLSCDLEVQLPC